MKQVVLLRHGESEWNKKGLFTGWTDVDLTEQGIQEAREAAKLLKKHGHTFDVAFTSVLTRSIRTLWIVLDEMDLMWIPVHRTWMLNERHYGDLQGKSKKEMARVHGERQVHKWRRSLSIRPPALDRKDPRHPVNDARYDEVDESLLPVTESLADCELRSIVYWKDVIEPTLRAGKRVLVVAHGNSLRGVADYLENLTDDEVENLNIPTGVPLVVELDAHLKEKRHFYLGDQQKVQARIKNVQNQAAL